MTDPSKKFLDNAYRASFMVYMNPNTDAAKKLKKYGIDKDSDDDDFKANHIVIDKYLGLHVAKMTMPDGAVEYWREVDSKHEVGTGFKASAFERSNEDGSTYIDSETGAPQTMVVFPGNTGSVQDSNRSHKIVRGDDMSDYFQHTEAFIDQVLEGMKERTANKDYTMGSVTFASHSLGANCLGAAQYMRENGLCDVETILIEPVGAGQALEQLAFLGAQKEFGTEEPTHEQQVVVAERYAQDVFSLRSDDKNIFQGRGADELYDNAMVGKTYEFKTKDPIHGKFSDHLSTNIVDAILRDGDEGIIRTEDKDLTPDEVLEGGKDLRWGGRRWARTKSQIFRAGVQASKLFNKAAAWELHERTTDARPNFKGIGTLEFDNGVPLDNGTSKGFGQSNLELIKDNLVLADNTALSNVPKIDLKFLEKVDL